MNHRIITIKDFAVSLNKNKFKIVMASVLGLVIALYLSQYIKPVFESKSDILIESTTVETHSETLELMATFKDLLVSTRIIDHVNAQLTQPIESNKLLEMVRIETGVDSQLMTIYVKAASEYEAQKIGNLFATSFKKEINEHFNNSNVIILNEASISSSTDDFMMTVIFGVIGFLLFGLLTYLIYLAIEIYRPKLDTEEKVEWINQNLLAILPTMKKFQLKRKGILRQTKIQLMASIIESKMDRYPFSIVLLHRNIKNKEELFRMTNTLEILNKNVLTIRLLDKDKHYLARKTLWEQYVNGEIALEQLIVKEENGAQSILGFIQAEKRLAENEMLINRLKTEAEQTFDVLIFTLDCHARANTIVLSRLIDNAIYIVNSKKTTISQATQDSKEIQQLNLSIFGTVLIK